MSSNLPVVSSWKGRSYMAGGVLGLAVGLLAAIYSSVLRRTGAAEPPASGPWTPSV